MTTLVREPLLLADQDGVPLLAFLPDFGRHVDLLPMRRVLQRTKFNRHSRTAGLLSVDKLFGTIPRVAIRTDYCHHGALRNEDPDGDATIRSYASSLGRIYQRLHPALFAHHEAMTAANAQPVWRMLPGSPFTTGIINQSNPLHYHRDQGNYVGVWSAMIVVRSGASGGHLNLPEFDLALECGDGSAVLFDGAAITHGVSPITCPPGAHRWSLVYYSMKGVWKCLPMEEEVARAKTMRTTRERRRADDFPAGRKP